MINEIYKKAMAKENKEIKLSGDKSKCLTYSVAEAAELYGCGCVYIRKLIKEGKLKADTSGKNWRIDKTEFMRWYKSQMS